MREAPEQLRWRPRESCHLAPVPDVGTEWRCPAQFRRVKVIQETEFISIKEVQTLDPL